MTPEPIIEIKNLSKQFGRIRAVNDLSFTVNRGDVFGFLGPNGAGKSTTIRMMLSLIKPTAGDIKIFGMDLNKHRKEILRKVGAIVEKPDFYKYLTAYENLEIFGKMSGIKPTKKLIMDMLESVDLHKRADSKVKTFSHGMKQRLGLAQALLHDPELIVLDEPTTGLDPQGMKEIRELIISLSKERNKTVLLSSHILYEVELVADSMVIINKGTARASGNVKELLSSDKLSVKFETDDTEKAIKALEYANLKEKITEAESKFITLNLTRSDISTANKAFVESGVNIYSIIPTRSLEDFYFEITKGN